MSKLIDALTLAVVTEEIEDVLQSSPGYDYQQVVAIPDLRQKLIAYVMSRIYNTDRVIEDEKSVINPKFVCCFSKQKMQIETLIDQGIQYILQQNLGWASRHIPEEVNPGYAPSHWFG